MLRVRPRFLLDMSENCFISCASKTEIAFAKKTFIQFFNVFILWCVKSLTFSFCHRQERGIVESFVEINGDKNIVNSKQPCVCSRGAQTFRYCRLHYVYFCELRPPLSSRYFLHCFVLLPHTGLSLLPRVCLAIFLLRILIR